MESVKERKKLPGLSREEEECTLSEVICIAQTNLERAKKNDCELEDELHELLETYTAHDKETLSIWHNVETQYQENHKELLRCQKARKKPYFGRIDFKNAGVEEVYYIGRVGIAKDSLHPVVIDWRAPIASVYYENSLGKCSYTVAEEGSFEIDLTRKRTYEIVEDQLKDYYDSDVIANDELLMKYLAKNKKAVLGEIIGTIQKEQNNIIRKTPKTNMIVQGVAGSGKTTVAMHRIAYILYNYEEYRPQDFYIIGSNRILLNYITGVLPDLDVYGISQMTMEQLFVRLLYEDWDAKKYQIISLDKKDVLAQIKGSEEWFCDLKQFCQEYEWNAIPRKEIRLSKDNSLLMEQERIEQQIRDFSEMSMQDKINLLNQILLSKLENEFLGRHVSYTAEEKREAQKFYKNYFGKEKWKGSIFELYESFLKEQKERGITITEKENCFDVYDLAALAYIYKRIKETDAIREASHIIIDEAQDFGMMAYEVLKYCIRGCTYTIMGDVSQNIHFGYGLNDWEELQKLMIKGTQGTFELLKKSYRNTVEISGFATEILRHGDFPIYPAEPVLRHGKPVLVEQIDTEADFVKRAAKLLSGWQKTGYETIAVLCRDETEAEFVQKELKQYIKLSEKNFDKMEFDAGIMILPVEYAKGLEFDAVLIWNPTREQYPGEDAYVKLLYVAATRALHELSVLHMGNLTDLIAIPVSEHKRMKSLEKKKEQKTAKKPEFAPKKEQEKKILETEKQLIPEKQTTSEKEAISEQSLIPVREIEEKIVVCEKKNNFLRKKYIEKLNTSRYKFNAVPDNKTLQKGQLHSKDFALKGVRKTGKYVEFISNDGVLRLTPIGESVVRVQFRRVEDEKFLQGYWEYTPQEDLEWKVRKGKNHFEVVIGEILIRIKREEGVLYFFDKNGNLLLNENRIHPRQIESKDGKLQSMQFFEWERAEKLYARGIFDEDLIPIAKKARYISFGARKLRMPLLLSGKGYAIGSAVQGTVMCCAIPMYGEYICMEDASQIDYYFIQEQDRKELLNLYKKLNHSSERD